jgi:hypothetical protein
MTSSSLKRQAKAHSFRRGMLRARAMSYSGASGLMAPASIKLAKTNRSISVFERAPKAGDIYAAINAPVNFAAFAGFDNAANSRTPKEG